MKLHVLGNRGPYADGGGATSGYLLESDEGRLILDMGSGTLSRLLSRFGFDGVAAALLSHAHFDHMADMLILSYYLNQNGLTLDVYLPPGDFPQIEMLRTMPAFRLIHPTPGKAFKLAGFSCCSFETRHPVRNYGYRIESDGRTFVYTGDTTVYDGLECDISGADLVLCDCAQPSGSCTPHMTQAEGKTLADATGIRILATHLPPGALQEFESLKFTKEGETYEI